MNSDDRELLRRRMGEVAALPPEHVERQAVARDIRDADADLESEWLDLLQYDERMRLELARVEPPPGLVQRLLAIADERSARTNRFFLPRRWVAGLAAALVIACLGILASLAIVQTRHSQALSRFASLAMVGHESEPELAITSPDWQMVEASMRKNVPFEIQRPRLDSGLQLVGGKAMTLNGNRVLYTRWQSGGTTCSLYQFCAKDFGLRSPLPRRSLTPSGRGAAMRVIVWTEGHCDYALVMENEAAGFDEQSV